MYKRISNLLDSASEFVDKILTGEIECDIPYGLKKSKDRDYLLDPWQFKQGIVRELSENNLTVTYNYLKIHTEDGKKPTNLLRKFVYTKKNCVYVVVVYPGDKTLAQVLSHGNSKGIRPFIRAAKSTLGLLKESSSRSVQKVYNDVKCKVLDDLPETLPEEQRQRLEDHFLPRNSKQVKITGIWKESTI